MPKIELKIGDIFVMKKHPRYAYYIYDIDKKHDIAHTVILWDKGQDYAHSVSSFKESLLERNSIWTIIRSFAS